MAFIGRTRDEIRDELLTQWAALYTAAGKRLLTSEGSHAYTLASALSVQLEGLEKQAEQTTQDILPDQATTDALNRHGYVYGIERLPGTRATATVTVTGPAAGTITIPAGTQMVYSDGTVYNVTSTSVALSGGTPTGTISVRAALVGSTGTRTVADVLTFVSAPSGLNTTGVVATENDGSDEESDEDYAARIISRMQERPGSGNRADWRAWVEEYTGAPGDPGIADVYVYPLLEPPATYPGTGTPDTPGTVTVVAVGPAQGDSTTNTRIVPYDDVTRTAGTQLVNITEYLLGDRLSDGTQPGDDNRIPPATMPDGNFSIEAINVTSAVNVLAVIVPPTAEPFERTGSFAVHASSTTTSLVVTGDATAANGKRALVLVGTSVIRGGYQQITLPTGSYNGGTGRTTFALSSALLATPSGNMYPGTAAWDDVRTAVFGYFDVLAPGDTTPASRWPTTGSSVMYRGGLAAAMVTGASLLSATISLPASDQTPVAKQVVVLGQLLVTA
jgi:uncharacterized phage protein gp47/JayE